MSQTAFVPGFAPTRRAPVPAQLAASTVTGVRRPASQSPASSALPEIALRNLSVRARRLMRADY